jgi:hypothetical protein
MGKNEKMSMGEFFPSLKLKIKILIINTSQTHILGKIKRTAIPIFHISIIFTF